MLSVAVRAELSLVAAKRSIPPENLCAVVQIESAGIIFWNVGGKNVPAARPEGHYFYARLSGEKRDRAVSLGLAHPRWGGVSVPAAREGVYDMIERMKQIDEAAALESCSWGVGQVMGSHWRSLGYASVQELVAECMKGLGGQVECMMRFIDKNGLRDELQRGDFTAFAAAYNGPGYKANAYDTKMAQAAAMYARVMQGPQQAAAVASEEIKRIQKNMAALGYFKEAVSGIENDALRDAIAAFQRDNGLVADGLYGTMTARAADAALAKKSNAKANKTVGTGFSGLAVSGFGEQVLSQLQMLPDLPHFKTIVTVVSGICVCLIIYGLYVKFTTQETA